MSALGLSEPVVLWSSTSFPLRPRTRHLPLMSTRPSLSGRVGVNRFQTAPSIWCGMFPRRVLASLRDRHLGPPMMGSGGCGGPIYRDVLAVRLTAGIRTRNGLALSIVPAGTSLHRSAEFVFSPVVFLLCTTRCELHECIDGTGALVCSVALSGQAPKPHSGAPQARGLTANAPTEQTSCCRDAHHHRTPGHAAAASFLVHRNSVPSTHMRCMMTASRRATATIARFMPRCRAIFMPQALSHDHLRLWVIRTSAA